MKIELTVKAFRAAYSGTSMFLVGEDILPVIETELGANVQYLVLGEDGCVYMAGETPGGLDTRIEPVGMGIGIRGILAGKKTASAAHVWDDYAKKQKMFGPAPVQVLTGMKSRVRLDASRFLLDCRSRELADLQAQMADKEAGLSYMRRKNEGLLLSLEKARRMIRGAGFGLQHIAAELPVGQDTIGPGGTVNTTRFSQLLPADSCGLWAVSLFGVTTSDDSSKAKGHLEVRVVRASDGACLAKAKRPYDKLNGWLQFDLCDASNNVFGDALLEVSWDGVEAGTPLLALSDVEADRFGDIAGRTLALRLMKGLAGPMDVAEADDISALPPLRRFAVTSQELQRLVSWAFEDLQPGAPDGGALISLPTDGKDIQTHPLDNGVSGVRFSSSILKGVCEVRATVLTEHEAGPTCLYSIVAVERFPSEDDRTRAQKVIDVLTGQSSGPVDGVHVGQALVKPMEETVVSLCLDGPLAHRPDLYMVVQVPEGDVSYGWCRWQQLDLGLSWTEGDGSLAPYCQPSSNVLRMRSIKFPSLAGRLEFVAGAKKLDELSKKLGFSPLLISEETGSLQTHPLQDQVSAAVFESGIPATTLRIASEVETVHDSAPPFLYVMAVVSPEVTEKGRAIRNVVSRIDPQDASTWQGINKLKTVQWQAKVLYAREPSTIEIELALALNAPADAVFAVMPVGQTVAYGWCRWYSLDITSAPAAQTLTGPADHD